MQIVSRSVTGYHFRHMKLVGVSRGPRLSTRPSYTRGALVPVAGSANIANMQSSSAVDTCSKCRCEPRAPSQRWCLACRNVWLRANRKRHGELPAAARRKAITRAYTNVLVKRGVLSREPCSCGNPVAQAHHPDYSNPRLVEWLCLACHRALHRPPPSPEFLAIVAKHLNKIARCET
jgi:hypothetical protein